MHRKKLEVNLSQWLHEPRGGGAGASLPLNSTPAGYPEPNAHLPPQDAKCCQNKFDPSFKAWVKGSYFLLRHLETPVKSFTSASRRWGHGGGH